MYTHCVPQPSDSVPPQWLTPLMRLHKTRSTHEWSTPHNLQRWDSTQSSSSQLTFLFFTLYILYIYIFVLELTRVRPSRSTCGTHTYAGIIVTTKKEKWGFIKPCISEHLMYHWRQRTPKDDFRGWLSPQRGESGWSVQTPSRHLRRVCPLSQILEKNRRGNSSQQGLCYLQVLCGIGIVRARSSKNELHIIYIFGSI